MKARVILRIIVCFMLMPVCAFAATRRDSDGAVASRTTGAVVMRSNATNSRGTSVTPSPASDREIKRSSISRVVPAEAESQAVANVRSRTAKNVTSRVTTPVVAGRSTGQRAATVSRTAVTNNAATNRTGITRGGVVSRKNTTNSTRVLKTRAATTQSEEKKDVASLIEGMTSQADLSNFCKTKYSECMDNFCNVLDEKQGRCSCSKNIKNYEKSENGLKQATAALQDVAQQIQYIGLTANEIDTLFAETEAEAAMSGTSDNSQLKNDLDKIKGLIVDVKPGTASSSDMSNDLSLDLSGLLDFNFSSSGFDLGTLFGTQSANTNSISNQRGEQLYKTAAARCRTDVLNECKKLGVDISVVINSYDMTIDRECIAYERTLNESNDEMLQTVRNAQSVLQRARLMVAQQKNSYDLRGCISALDSCMQDDFVCGSDYEKCLDPTGKYIVDGEIIVGSKPGRSGDVNNAGLYDTWDYSNSNAWGSGSIDAYLNTYLTATYPESNLTVMANYLHNKIGKITDDGRARGMCVAVLNRCRDYTYTEGKNGKYNPNNRVIREWMERTFIKIKNAQDSLLANYAESCVSDVTSCLTENNYDKSDKISTKSNVAINACRNRILTCMSVNADTTTSVSDTMINWVAGIMGASSANQENSGQGGGEDLWGTSKLTINFDTDGGTSVADATCAVGGTFTLPNAPTKSGYTFDAWTVNDNEFNAGESADCTAEILGVSSGAATITAIWIKDNTSGGGNGSGSDDTGDEEPATTITVKYNTDGGTSVADATCTVGTTFALPAAPTRDGYIFRGWAVNGTSYGANATVDCVGSVLGASVDGTATITAVWLDDSTDIITLVYDMAGEHGAIPDGKCVVGKSFSLPSVDDHGYYKFIGWRFGSSDTRYAEEAVVECDATALNATNGTATITAVWLGENLIRGLTLDPLGGVQMGIQKVYYADGYGYFADSKLLQPITYDNITPPTRDGYVFKGYSFDLLADNYMFGSVLGYIPDRVTTLYADWEPVVSDVNVELIYDFMGGIPYDPLAGQYSSYTNMKSINILSQDVPRPADVYGRDGYYLSGSEYAWYPGVWDIGNWRSHSAILTDKKVYFAPNWLPASYELSGSEIENGATTYTLYFDTGGIGSVAPITCTYGQTITMPSVPSESGYVSVGWSNKKNNVRLTQIYPANTEILCNRATFGVESGAVYLWAQRAADDGQNYFNDWFYQTEGGMDFTCRIYNSSLPASTYGHLDDFQLTGWYSPELDRIFSHGEYLPCQASELGKTKGKLYRLNPVLVPTKTTTASGKIVLAIGSQLEGVIQDVCTIGGKYKLPSAIAPSGTEYLSKFFHGWETADGKIYPANAEIDCSESNLMPVDGTAAILAHFTNKMFADRYIDFVTEDKSVIGLPERMSCRFGQEFTLPTAVPTRSGYTFAGWLIYDGAFVRDGQVVKGSVVYQPGDTLKCDIEDLGLRRQSHGIVTLVTTWK